MATLSKADKEKLSAEQQKQILNLKEQYAAASTKEERDAIHGEAEKIRNSAGYSGGAQGNGYRELSKSANDGGTTAEQMKSELDAYKAANTNYGSDKYDGPDGGWTNGYSAAMNVRSMANRVRQQMEANSKAWHTADAATKEYLHNQNVELAKLLPVESTYDPATGKWSTWNTNYGYGADAQWEQKNIADNWKKFYGYTDADREKWNSDTSHYYNFVDTRVPGRNSVDESGGYTGQYAQFRNGPYASLLRGTRGKNMSQFTDVIGDGFGEEETFLKLPQYDENGNIIQTAPALKNNNSASAYSQQFQPVAQNGVLQGKGQKVSAMDPTSGSNNAEGQAAYRKQTGGYRVNSSSSAGGFEDYLQQLYAASLEAQLAALRSGYAANLSELEAGEASVDSVYAEQKRQTSGESARQSAAWREMANAYGLNSGAVGQAGLVQRNQLQSDLNQLNAAQAAARTELQRQRLLLGQQYQLAIEEAIAENKSQLALKLYEEAVRAEEAMEKQEQFYANLAMEYGKAMLNFAKSSSSGLSRVQEQKVIQDAVGNGYISDAQGMLLAEKFGLL